MSAKSGPELKLKPPFEIAFSENLKVRYGYRDAHVELEAKVPMLPLGTFKKSFDRDEFKLGKGAFEKARMWKDVPEFQRRRDAPPEPFVERLSDRIEMRYGYADAHAELVITLIEEPKKSSLLKDLLFGTLKNLPKEFRQSFTADEIESAQHAFSKADTWSNLPEAERQRIGA